MANSLNPQQKMLETPVPRLITSLAIPTVISMLVTNIYNMADTFFVSTLGTSHSASIGIVSTLALIILAIGLMFGHGAGSIISRTLGSGNTDRADTLTSTAFFTTLIIGAIIMVLGLIFITPFMRILGSTETVLPYAKTYAVYILLAAPFTMASYVLNNIMRYEGKARLAMIGLTTGAILNLILDPIFIFGFKMGVHGAGLATATSQVIGCSILLFLFVSGRTQCKISIKKVSFSEIPVIIKNGLPSLARQGMNCISSILLNQSAAFYGDSALAAVSIVNQILAFIVSIMIGIGQGFQPVAGYNYGAGKFARVKQGFYFTFVLGECVLILLSFVFFFAAKDIIHAFRNDPEVIKIGTTMLRLQCISLICQPFGVCANMLFQCIGKTARATLLATTRNGLYLIPILLILPRVFGLFGILSAQPLADLLSLLTAIPLILFFFRSLHDKT